MSESVKADTDPVASLAPGEYAVPSLEGVHGRIEFEGPRDHVLLSIEDGRVTLSRERGEADCVITSDVEGELQRLVRGEVSLVTAVLQGNIAVRGDPMLVLKVAGSMPALGSELRERAQSVPGA